MITTVVKLYCFIYEIKENQMYRQDDDAEIYKDDYFIHDENDETIYVQSWKIDKPQYSEDTGKPFLYMYSLDGDVNRAMNLMHEAVKKTIEDIMSKARVWQDTLKTFEEKQEYIKDKYPSINAPISQS